MAVEMDGRIDGEVVSTSHSTQSVEQGGQEVAEALSHKACRGNG